MKTRTTNADLEQFKKYVHKWADKLGLMGVDILVEKDGLPETVLARCHRYNSSNYKIFVNSSYYGGKMKPREWERYAYHEVMHILLGEFDHLAESRYASEEQMGREVERVATTMENHEFGRAK